MGQYYKAICLETKQFVSSYDYDNGAKLMEHSWVDNGFVGAVETLLEEGGKWFGKSIVWGGGKADGEIGSEYNLYDSLDRRKKLKPKLNNNSFKYLVNMDDWVFVDVFKTPVSDVWHDRDGLPWEYRVHPLPLLTCEGNGRGGGDFRGSDPNNLIGKWARKKIMVTNEYPENMKELIFELVE